MLRSGCRHEVGTCRQEGGCLKVHLEPPPTQPPNLQMPTHIPERSPTLGAPVSRESFLP